MPKHRPIITLTSDFGLTDSYVAAMKAVLVRHAPDARLIDITHKIPPQDVLCASITLERAVDGFPSGTVHLVVVDPGVGSSRRLIVAKVHHQMIVCPDNGLIAWTARRHGPVHAFEIIWKPARHSSTFHGRDILAPVAGMLCSEAKSLSKLTRKISDPVLLDVTPGTAHDRKGRVIHIDHFGNATTNLPDSATRQRERVIVRVRGKVVGRVRRTYNDVAPGEPVALVGSSGLLEIAVRDGSAAKSMKIRVGDEVVLK